MISINFLLTSLVIFFTSYSQLILRSRLLHYSKFFSAEKIGISFLCTLATDIWIISSVVAFVLSFVCWSFALLNNINATKVYPILSSIVICSVFFGNYLIFQDKVSFINLFGGVTIIIGIFLLLK